MEGVHKKYCVAVSWAGRQLSAWSHLSFNYSDNFTLNVPFYCIINNSHIDKDQNLIKDWALQYRIQKLIQGQYDQGLVDLMARVIVVTYLTNIAVGISGEYGSIGEGEQAAP